MPPAFSCVTNSAVHARTPGVILIVHGLKILITRLHSFVRSPRLQ